MTNKAFVLLLAFIFTWMPAAQQTKQQTIKDYFDKAKECVDISNIAQAIAIYKHIITIDPQNFLAHINCANLFFMHDMYDQAYDFYEKSIELNPLSDAAHFNLGLLLESEGICEQAIESYKNACEANPKHHKALLQLAKLLKEQNCLQESANYFHKILSVYPKNFESHYNLAKIYQKLEPVSARATVGQSLYHYHIATELQENDPDLLTDYANVLNRINETEKALELYLKVVELIPYSAPAHYNVGYTLKKLNRMEESLPFYEKAVQLDPESPFMRFGISLAYLTAGNFKDGWREYEYRWDTHNIPKKKFPKPLWNGESLKNKTILLYTEQGLGDNFQFIRYAKVAKQMGATVIFESKKSLANIISLCPYIDHIVTQDQEIPDFDFYAPLMSMPFLCSTTRDTIPCQIPYLYAKEELVKKWENILCENKNFKIGICWQGNTSFKTKDLQNVFSGRSIKLKYLQPLMNIEHVSMYSLQKIEHDQGETLKNYCKLKTLGKDFDTAQGSFCDTAAVIQNLDLVITVDTSIAHLAGGLGAPVWVLIPDPPDFRWMTDIDHSPWYPTMKLFRQTKSGSWQDVILKIKQKLQSIVENHQELLEISKQIKTLKQRQKELKIKVKGKNGKQK